MQGGHHPKLPFQWYIDLLQHIVKNIRTSTFMDSVRRNFSIRGDVPDAPSRSDLGIQDGPASDQFRAAAAKSLWIGCAKRISPLKINSDEWLEVMQVAHELGLKSSATNDVRPRGDD